VKKKPESACAELVHPNLRTYFGFCLYKSAARLRLMLDGALAKHKIVAPQLGILRLLDWDGPTSQIELGRALSIDKATMVKLIDGLEARSLVMRVGSGKDRRVKLVEITSAGRKVLKVASKTRDGVEKEFLSALTESECQFLREILPKLLK
jgi:DNA-binding MarR family transcriptional regulator